MLHMQHHEKSLKYTLVVGNQFSNYLLPSAGILHSQE